MVTMASELAREIEWARLASGLSVEELLDALRERYYRENYGNAPIAQAAGFRMAGWAAITSVVHPVRLFSCQ